MDVFVLVIVYVIVIKEYTAEDIQKYLERVLELGKNCHSLLIRGFYGVIKYILIASGGAAGFNFSMIFYVINFF